QPSPEFRPRPVDPRHRLLGPDLQKRHCSTDPDLSRLPPFLWAAVDPRRMYARAVTCGASATTPRKVALQHLESLVAGGCGPARRGLADAPRGALRGGSERLGGPPAVRLNRGEFECRHGRGGLKDADVRARLGGRRAPGTGRIYRAVPGPVDCFGAKARDGDASRLLVVEPDGRADHVDVRDSPPQPGVHARSEPGPLRLYPKPDALGQ